MNYTTNRPPAGGNRAIAGHDTSGTHNADTHRPCACPGAPWGVNHVCPCSDDAHAFGPASLCRLGDLSGVWAVETCTTCGAFSLRPLGDGTGLDLTPQQSGEMRAAG